MNRSSSSPLIVVDGVSKPRRVHNGQLELNPFLFDVYSVFDDLHSLVYTLCETSAQRRCQEENHTFTPRLENTLPGMGGTAEAHALCACMKQSLAYIYQEFAH